jgi:hypothetical protein
MALLCTTVYTYHEFCNCWDLHEDRLGHEAFAVAMLGKQGLESLQVLGFHELIVVL